MLRTVWPVLHHLHLRRSPDGMALPLVVVLVSDRAHANRVEEVSIEPLLFCHVSCLHDVMRALS